MSQISSPSSIASVESTAAAPKKRIGVPSNNVYTVMLAVTCLLLLSGLGVVYHQYRTLYGDASIFLTDLAPRR